MLVFVFMMLTSCKTVTFSIRDQLQGSEHVHKDDFSLFLLHIFAE